MSNENEDGTEDTGQEIIVETESSAPPAETADDEDELSAYSTKVQTRISRITEKYRKEQRDREEATRIAQKLLEENQQLKSRVQALDTGYLTEYGSRLEHQEHLVKGAYRVAYESGDSDAMLAAQEDLARIVLEKQRYATAKQRSEASVNAQRTERETPVQAQPQAQQAPRPDPKAQSWAEKNKWFGEDRVMTTAALTIHQTLIEDEGFDPNTEEYYTEIDRRLRSEFPQKFAARNPSQVAIAKRLNVPLEEYAKYVKD
jgi:hypothetical protein